MRTIQVIIQYDGTNYHGWQVQDNALTIQEVLETALSNLTGERVHIVGCGRTDTGVHAHAYVFHFLSDTTIPADRLPYALNALLPDDIVCFFAKDMPPEFHAKKSARKKRYTYLIENSKFPNVFYNSRAWHYPYPLDVDAMRRAAKAFLGTHDFLGFAAAGFTVKTTTRTIYALDIEKTGDLIRIDVVGNGFLYNMVRIIAGTLVFVGAGKIDPDSMEEIIASRDRSRAGITAPACGLYLSEVYYQDEEEC